MDESGVITFGRSIIYTVTNVLALVLLYSAAERPLSLPVPTLLAASFMLTAGLLKLGVLTRCNARPL